MDNENDVWIGTQSDFDDLPDLDEDVVYIIVEDGIGNEKKDFTLYYT